MVLKDSTNPCVFYTAAGFFDFFWVFLPPIIYSKQDWFLNSGLEVLAILEVVFGLDHGLLVWWYVLKSCHTDLSPVWIDHHEVSRICFGFPLVDKKSWLVRLQWRVCEDQSECRKWFVIVNLTCSSQPGNNLFGSLKRLDKLQKMFMWRVSLLHKLTPNS